MNDFIFALCSRKVNLNMDNSNAVKQFTEESSGIKCPSTPLKMDLNSARFIIRMVMSEMHELACTVTKDRDESLLLMKECLSSIDECKKYNYSSDIDLIAAQADSMVDAWYYILNTAAKHGMNLSKLFEVIHDANMAKKDPSTGKFIKRETDGKIIKPEEWKPPDVEGEIRRQMEQGSWKMENTNKCSYD